MSEFKGIVLHWSAGQNIPNADDFQHYHFMIDGEGNIHNGKFKPEDNLVCISGHYAEHTGGGNTGRIGVALCGMLGYNPGVSGTNYPLNQKQFESAMSFVNQLCKRYNIPITPETVLNHKEFGDSHPKTTSYTKIEICFLPFQPELKPEEIGNFIRTKILWYGKQ